jgi:hypothetical protein
MDAIIDEAEEIGLRDAAAYLGKCGRYPTEDDTDDFSTEAWEAAWGDLQRQGADDGLFEACCEAWRRGFLGTQA